MPAKLAIACLGNPILGDDAFGLLAAKELEGIRGVDLLALEEGGLDAALRLFPYSRVLVIDALETSEGKAGELISLKVEELSAIKGLGGHSLGLADALQALSLLSGEGPRSVEILACRVRPVTTYGDRASPVVVEAACKAAQMARAWARSALLGGKP